MNLFTAAGDFKSSLACSYSTTEIENTYAFTPDGAYCPGIGVVEPFQIVLLCDSGGSISSDNFTLTGARSSDLDDDDDTTPTPTLSPRPSPAPTPAPTVLCALGEQLSSAGSCAACPEGTFGNRTTPPWVCFPCATGLFQPNTGESRCLACPVGSYSSDDGRFCISCQPGQFAEGGSSCASCSVATYAAVPLNDACSECGEGFYTGALSGATACTKCEAGTSSSSSRLACDVAAPDYDLASSGGIEPCPAHAVCDGGTAMPRPESGYWVDRRKLESAHHVYACPRETCRGGRSSELCWEAGRYNSTACAAQEELLCDEGAQGILCQSCEDGYTFNSALSKCLLCEGADNTVPLIIFGALAGVALVLASLYAHGLRAPASITELHAFGFVRYVTKGHLKVSWATYQIVSTVAWSLTMVFPEPFGRFLYLLNFLSFDFLSLDCVSGEANFFSRVYVTSFVPMGASLLNAVVYWVRAQLVEGDDKEKNSRRRELFSAHGFMFLLLTYCVIPPCALIQFQALDCDTLEHTGESFLRVDSNINCDSPDYRAFLVADVFFVLIFMSLPLLWWVLLWRERESLNPNGMRELTALRNRENNTELLHLAFLFSDYRPQCW